MDPDVLGITFTRDWYVSRIVPILACCQKFTLKWIISQNMTNQESSNQRYSRIEASSVLHDMLEYWAHKLL